MPCFPPAWRVSHARGGEPHRRDPGLVGRAFSCCSEGLNVMCAHQTRIALATWTAHNSVGPASTGGCRQRCPGRGRCWAHMKARSGSGSTRRRVTALSSARRTLDYSASDARPPGYGFTTRPWPPPPLRPRRLQPRHWQVVAIAHHAEGLAALSGAAASPARSMHSPGSSCTLPSQTFQGGKQLVATEQREGLCRKFRCG